MEKKPISLKKYPYSIKENQQMLTDIKLKKAQIELTNP